VTLQLSDKRLESIFLILQLYLLLESRLEGSLHLGDCACDRLLRLVLVLVYLRLHLFSHLRSRDHTRLTAHANVYNLKVTNLFLNSQISNQLGRVASKCVSLAVIDTNCRHVYISLCIVQLVTLMILENYT